MVERLDHRRNGINLGDQIYAKRIDYAEVERIKSAVWVGDLCLKNRDGGWTPQPAMVFWQPVRAMPDHQPYFALHFDHFHRLMITSGMSAATGVWQGVETQTGEIIFSRFQHDVRGVPGGGVVVDGGRDYPKTLGSGGIARRVMLRLAGPQFVEVPHETAVVAICGDHTVVTAAGPDSLLPWCADALAPDRYAWLTDGLLEVFSLDDLASIRLAFG